MVPVSKDRLVFRVLPVVRAVLPGGGDQCLGQWTPQEGNSTPFQPQYLQSDEPAMPQASGMFRDRDSSWLNARIAGHLV